MPLIAPRLYDRARLAGDWRLRHKTAASPHLWEGRWMLPFRFLPLGSPDKVVSARRMRRQLPVARDRIGNLNVYKPQALAALTPLIIGDVDWSMIVSALAPGVDLAILPRSICLEVSPEPLGFVDVSARRLAQARDGVMAVRRLQPPPSSRRVLGYAPILSTSSIAPFIPTRLSRRWLWIAGCSKY
jgi:hypothetical protein